MHPFVNPKDTQDSANLASVVEQVVYHKVNAMTSSTIIAFKMEPGVWPSNK